MTANDLIAAFETLADAPDGVRRLRELVLQLAVRGKLVGQDPDEGPVADAITSIKKQRSKVGSLPADRMQDFGTLATEDWPFEPPPSWRMLPFGDLFVEVFTGPFGTSLKAHEYRQGGTPVVNPQNLRSGVIVPTEGTCVGPETLTRLHNFVISERDIVVARRGEMGRCAVVTSREAGWLCGTGSLVLRPPVEVAPRFVTTFLGSPWTVDRLGGDSVGSTMKNLNQKIMANLPFGLPPLAEQHRIVARVDELMGLLDRLEAARTARDDVRRAARDAALAALRDAEDIDAVEAAWGRIAGQMQALFAEPEDVGPLRQAVLELGVNGGLTSADLGGWSSVRLGKLLREPLANGRSVPDGAGFPVLRLTALRGKIVDTRHQKPGAWTEEEGSRFQIEAGDLLVVRGNGSRDLVARASRVLKSEKVAYPDTAIRVRTRPEQVETEYLHYVWHSSGIRRQLEMRARTTNGIWKVSQGDLEGVEVPLPPLAEQHRIVAKVDALMSLCDALEARLTAARALHAQFAAAAVHHLDV